MQDDKQLHQLLLANEGRIMDSLANSHPKADRQVRAELMSSDIIFLNGFTGWIEGEPLRNTFDQVRITSWNIPNSRFIRVNNNVAILAFHLIQEGMLQGHPLPKESYSTSIYCKHNGCWKAIFHQESIKSL